MCSNFNGVISYYDTCSTFLLPKNSIYLNPYFLLCCTVPLVWGNRWLNISDHLHWIYKSFCLHLPVYYTCFEDWIALHKCFSVYKKNVKIIYNFLFRSYGVLLGVGHWLRKLQRGLQLCGKYFCENFTIQRRHSEPCLEFLWNLAQLGIKIGIVV